MKRTLLSALIILVASTAVAPIAAAKAIEDIQSARLNALDTQTKTTVEHKIEVIYLNNQTKAIENIQAERLNALDARIN